MLAKGAILWPAAALLCLSGWAGAGEAPLSSVHWLTQAIAPHNSETAHSAAGPSAPPKHTPQQTAPPVEAQQGIVSEALDVMLANTSGILSSRTSGLPHDVWGDGDESDIIQRIRGLAPPKLPALTALFMTVMLSDAPPLRQSTGEAELLLARVDALFAMGALDAARALIEHSAIMTPALFERAFEIDLLTGRDAQTCALLAKAPGLSRDIKVRVFCLAQAGKSDEAGLVLDLAGVLGQVDAAQNVMLRAFLRSNLADTLPDAQGDAFARVKAMLPNPRIMTPLAWRLLDTLGAPLNSTDMPPAYAHSDLRDVNGLKAHISAAARLTKKGVLAPNVLFGLYQHRPPASGGMWDDMRAVQRFNLALKGGDDVQIQKTLPKAWAKMRAAGLGTAFANIAARDVMRAANRSGAQRDAARAIAFNIALLSDDYKELTQSYRPQNPREAFLRDLAQGISPTAIPPEFDNAQGRALLRGLYAPPEVSPPFAQFVASRRYGEGILYAIAQIERGIQNAPEHLPGGLMFLRSIGLEDAARRTVLQALLLKPQRGT